MHARDYMTYAYLQMGMDAQAKANMEQAMAVAAKPGGTQGAAGAGPNMFALAAIPARYAMERQQWAEAAALEPRPAPGTPYTEAITHFVRAIGAARAGRPTDAAADVARLAALRDREIEMKDEYWASQVDIQRRGADAWVMFAQGRKDAAIAQMRETADMEDLTDKSAVTPGPIAPARELLGYMLIENNQPKEALVEFEAVMKKEPNRFLAIYGAARRPKARSRPPRRRATSSRSSRCARTPATSVRSWLTRARWRTSQGSDGIRDSGTGTSGFRVQRAGTRAGCDWRAILLSRKFDAHIRIDHRHGGVVPGQTRALQRVQRAVEREDQAQQHTDLRDRSRGSTTSFEFPC